MNSFFGAFDDMVTYFLITGSESLASNITFTNIGGGLIFGAFFMATDYVTSPMDQKGQLIYGILLGVLTGLFRFFGTSAEGVSYAIIISNLLVPLIDKLTLKGGVVK